ncbi:MAG: polar amino acid transport system substrate-binding protein [Lentisphaeria bacterium]|jgi:polar amino acid transport system substrate-binding protein
MLLSRILMCCWLGVISAHLNASDKHIYKVAVSDIPTNVYTNADNKKILRPEIKGILKEIFRRVDIDFELSNYPPARVYDGLKNGKVELWLGVPGVNFIEDYVVYGKSKLSDLDISVYSLDAKVVNSVEDLSGQSVVLLHGYGYGNSRPYFDDEKNNVRVHIAHSRESAFKMLQNRRADYLLDYKQAVNAFATTNTNIPIFQTYDLGKIPVMFVGSKRVKHMDKLLKELDLVVHDMYSSGRLGAVEDSIKSNNKRYLQPIKPLDE